MVKKELINHDKKIGKLVLPNVRALTFARGALVPVLLLM